MRRRVAVLGSTGSIGRQALEVIGRFPEHFELVGLGAGKQVELLADQVRRFGVGRCSIASAEHAAVLRNRLGPNVQVFSGGEGLQAIAAESNAEIVLAATDGAVAFAAVFEAVRRGIDIALANKELIVAAGELLVVAARKSGARLLPVDSEHSAIFQCCAGESLDSIAKVILTASGGPFRTWTAAQIEQATITDALRHPTWSMGVKNSVDSATLLNKGLEVIEASRLFGLSADCIDVLIHPTSIVHGMIVFRDGSIKMQAAPPDMRGPIGYALAYPMRLPTLAPQASTVALLGGDAAIGVVHYGFEQVDHQRFPAVALAFRALRAGGTAPATLSAANEIAVRAFQRGEIRFPMIMRVVESVLDRIPSEALCLETFPEVDRQARRMAEACVAECNRQTA